MFSVGSDYHAQLEQYGRAAGLLHKARVNTPTPIGWWSWTAYYFGLNQGAAVTTAQWLSENLKPSGYIYYQIDEGYQYARGEYTTPDVNLFPGGLEYIGREVWRNGLTFGVWAARDRCCFLVRIRQVASRRVELYNLDSSPKAAERKPRLTVLVECDVRIDRVVVVGRV